MLHWIEGKKIFVPVTLLVFGFVFSQISAAGGYVAALPYVMAPTVDMAFILFFFAFTASSLARLAPGPGPKFLLRNRRYIGLSFAFTHGVHGVLVLSNLAFTDATRPIPVLLAGAIAYFFILLMALTSNNFSVRKLGAKKWKRLHKVGSYYVWAIFVATTAADLPHLGPRTWIAVLAFVALGLRLAAWRKGRRARAS